MIRLLESNDSNIKLYETVKYAGYEWFVIQINGDIATLLSSEFFEINNPNIRRRGEAWDDYERRKSSFSYKDSFVRQYLLDKILPELESKGAKLIPTTLSDVGCTDKVWLLSKKEGLGVNSILRDNVESLTLTLSNRDSDYTYDTERFYIVIRTRLENLVPATPSKPDTSGLTSDEKERIEEEIFQFTEKYGEGGEFAEFDVLGRYREADKFILSKFREIPSFDASSVTLLRCKTGRLPGIEGYFEEFWDVFAKDNSSGWHSGWTDFVELNKVWRSSDPVTQYIIDHAAFSNEEDASYHVQRVDSTQKEIDKSEGDIVEIHFDI